MKQNTALLSLLSLLFFIACKKEEVQANTDDIRLKEIETIYRDGQKGYETIEYDASGRISKISSRLNNGPVLSLFDVTYSNNEIRLIYLQSNTAAKKTSDTIWLVLDNKQRILQRRSHRYLAVVSLQEPPQNRYTYDTTNFEYDAAGLLKKQNWSLRDSLWSNNGMIRIYNTYATSTTNYTIQGDKVVNANVSGNREIQLRHSGSLSISNYSHTSKHTYHYTKAYPFKTDFSNAAVLNEMNFFNSVGFSKSHAFIPNMIETSAEDKDGNGTITSSDNYTINQHYTYNSYGFIASRTDDSNPGRITNYIYTK